MYQLYIGKTKYAAQRKFANSQCTYDKLLFGLHFISLSNVILSRFCKRFFIYTINYKNHYYLRCERIPFCLRFGSSIFVTEQALSAIICRLRDFSFQIFKNKTDTRILGRYQRTIGCSWLVSL